jgi:hypothetical protein
MCLASSASPRQWLILCAPVWFRSSRFRVDVRAALAIGQTLGVKDRAGPTHVVRVQICQFFLKGRGLADLFVGDVDVVHHGLEFGREDLPAVFAKVALTVGHFQKLLCHAVSLCVVKKP